ncbi:MAG TPA: metallophosphoesterase family protein [Bryobacteraceae bacterium]|jgi:hypothetical protein|nr:metallophosphoesterase family protein [Bryobacteraceae bacterium]
MARTLIIPDIHNKVRQVDAILDRLRRQHSFDRVICLGDYFDKSSDTVEEAQITAQWLKRNIEDTDYIFLLGNHDLHYLSDHPSFRSSGYTQDKARAINRILTAEHWSRCHLHAWVDGWLVTHAGWNTEFGDWENGSLRHGIDARIQQARLAIMQQGSDPLLLAGRSRGGDQNSGGILWQDMSEAQPITGLRQIVGHTPCREIVTREQDGGVIKFCDTRLGYFALLHEGGVQAIETGLARFPRKRTG